MALSVSAARLAPPASSGANVSGPTGEIAWEPFTPERVAALRDEGRPVFINFTAAWCLSCQVNDRVALRSASVRRAFADAGVALLKADWTTRDAVITNALRAFGRTAVPLYVLYPSDEAAPPEVLPAILTPGIVLDAIGRADGESMAGS